MPRHPGELMPELPEQQLSFENLNYFWPLWKGFGNLHGHQQHKRLRTFLNTGVKAFSILSSCRN
jgi:hypothetical protein